MLTAEGKGFKQESFGPVTLQVNQTLRVDFSLSPGNASDVVHVSATGAQLLAPENATVSQVMGSAVVSQIPLASRAWQGLIGLTAGVNPGPPGLSGSANAYNINGQRDKSNQYYVDGVTVAPASQGRVNNFNLPLDAIQEFSVQENGYSAEYGDVAGGVINLVSKSGTNQFHGSLFEFFRNDVLDAEDFFVNGVQGQPKVPLRYNQFGGSIGGPIRRDKTLFFADYQGLRQRTASAVANTIPAGLSEAAATDPAAAALIALIPPPNQPAGSIPNYVVTRPSLGNQDIFDVRLDQHFSDKNTLFGRYSFQNNSVSVPTPFGAPLGGSVLGESNVKSRIQNVVVGDTYIFRPNLFNEFRFGLFMASTSATSINYGKNTADEFGIPGVNDGTPGGFGLPFMEVITPTGTLTLGDGIITPVFVNSRSVFFSDKLTYIKGRHTIKVGFDYSYDRGSNYFTIDGHGLLVFTSVAQFEAGTPLETIRDSFPQAAQPRTPSYGMFIQDDFKVTPRLTVNLGLRYDILPFFREANNRLSNFNPATITMVVAGSGVGSSVVNTDYKDVSPRIGLAYQLTGDGKTVLRSGFGMAYTDSDAAPGQLNLPFYNPPFYGSYTKILGVKLSTGIPAVIIPSANAPTGGLRYFPPNERNPYTTTWSLGIQRALARDTMMEVDYVGTTGNHLNVVANINAGAPGGGAPPFGSAISTISDTENAAHSNYNGLQTKVEKRYGNGLYLLGSYTYSKSIDNQSNGTDSTSLVPQEIQNPFDLAAERGLSSFNRTHRFAFTGIWRLPVGRGEAFGGKMPGAMNVLIGGWQLAGTFTAESGEPFTISENCSAVGSTNNFQNSEYCRPNLTGNPYVSNPHFTSVASGGCNCIQYLNASAFSIPHPAAYGNLPRNFLQAPGDKGSSLSISKYFPLGKSDTRRVQFRFEMFNPFNWVEWGAPHNSITTAPKGLGQITSDLGPRVIQLGLRLEF